MNVSLTVAGGKKQEFFFGNITKASVNMVFAFKCVLLMYFYIFMSHYKYMLSILEGTWRNCLFSQQHLSLSTMISIPSVTLFHDSYFFHKLHLFCAKTRTFQWKWIFSLKYMETNVSAIVRTFSSWHEFQSPNFREHEKCGILIRLSFHRLKKKTIPHWASSTYIMDLACE